MGRREEAGEGNSDTHEQQESEGDLGEAGRQRSSTQQQNESFLDCHAPPLPPTALLPHHPVKRQTRVRERERELPCAPLEPCPLGEEETNGSSALALPEEKS